MDLFTIVTIDMKLQQKVLFLAEMAKLLTYDVRFKFKGESSNVLNVGVSSVSCSKLDSLESRLKIPGKF